MHLGLIGGIGPAATVDYYERLSPVFSGAEHDLTIVQADTKTLIGNAGAQNHDAQVAVYLELLERLKRAGAGSAAITSITGHFCYHALEPVSPLPLHSIFAALNAHIARLGLARIGVLGGTGVMASRLYGKLDADVIVSANDIDELGALYFEIAGSARCTPAQRARFFEAGAHLIDAGAQTILLGGTDLGLAFGGQYPGYPVMDAVAVHVEALMGTATR